MVAEASRASPASEFDPNDFDEIYAAYFEDLIAADAIRADPSGWARTETNVEIPAISPVPREELAHYVTDNRRLIGPEKEVLVGLLSGWDRRGYGFDEVTLTPSISTASLAVLFLLRAEGVKTVVFETPGYYATMDQADALGLRIVLVPTRHDSGYRWTPASFISRMNGTSALWLTQPRYALGFDQAVPGVVELLDALKPTDFLVVDETADQAWPTALSAIEAGVRNSNLIKIRGYMKPLGLNALRLAFVLHSAKWRPQFQELQWLVGAALDRYSLASAVQMAQDPELFRSMLSAARTRVISLRRRLLAFSAGMPMAVSTMENGYLGTLRLDWGGIDDGSRRMALLEFCRDRKMPVTLGAAMRFARDSFREHVRLNFFMPGTELDYCAAALRDFMRRL
jgi:histidinol-phosphate/aromatic aminotransferase/cobyric acid decarboxylase-like protein